MNSPVTDSVIIDEAAQWMALLHSGQVNDQQIQALGQWRASDVRHEEVWQLMSKGVGQLPSSVLRGVPRPTLLRSLQAPSSRRRFLQGSLGLAALISGAQWLSRESGWSLDGEQWQTATGQRQARTLADGSAAILDARSRLVQRFDINQRLLHLYQGNLWLDVAREQRPFIVETDHGQIRALGTRFTVQRDDDSTQLVMLRSQALITTRSGRQQRVDAGQSVRFDADGLLDSHAGSDADVAWIDGRLEARDWSLGQVVERLRSYRPGVIRISAQAAALRLSGLFPLDDSDRALQLLGLSLPIAVTRYSAYWITIDVVSV